MFGLLHDSRLRGRSWNSSGRMKRRVSYQNANEVLIISDRHCSQRLEQGDAKLLRNKRFPLRGPGTTEIPITARTAPHRQPVRSIKWLVTASCSSPRYPGTTEKCITHEKVSSLSEFCGTLTTVQILLKLWTVLVRRVVPN